MDPGMRSSDTSSSPVPSKRFLLCKPCKAITVLLSIANLDASSNLIFVQN